LTVLDIIIDIIDRCAAYGGMGEDGGQEFFSLFIAGEGGDARGKRLLIYLQKVSSGKGFSSLPYCPVNRLDNSPYMVLAKVTSLVDASSLSTCAPIRPKAAILHTHIALIFRGFT